MICQIAGLASCLMAEEERLLGRPLLLALQIGPLVGRRMDRKTADRFPTILIIYDIIVIII